MTVNKTLYSQNIKCQNRPPFVDKTANKSKTSHLSKCIALTAFLSLFGVLLLSACNSSAKPQLNEIRHVVKRGDTMWSICTEYKPAKMDMREYVAMCCEASGTDGAIFPGDTVIVFAEAER